ncbi:sulfatase family protein [Colwellia piezophila]|uniref:sulfatase family protein n=1 Tax=Colwellia piezophila TaxID=211668 RepID=UPI0003650C77|nr:sulfatase [Colwellia piezophila]
MKEIIIPLLASLISLGSFASTEKQNASLNSLDMPPKPTNILWIYMEDQNGWNNAYGDFTVATPNIASFAKSGVLFNNTIMPAPVCSATRSAIITGKHQAALGTHQHRSSRSTRASIFLPEGYKTVPELFKEAGFATFNIGKDDYNFKYDRSTLYSEHPGPVVGWDGGMDGENFDWAKELKNKPFFGQIQLKGGKWGAKALPTFGLEKVDRSKMKLPAYYPDTDTYRNDWALHYETQIASDIELKQILGKLQENGLLENTAVFWFADHGMGLPRHKQYLYEDGVRVPFIVNWPAGEKYLQRLGKKRDELISGLDIPATSLALSGIAIPDYYDGKNLFADNFSGHKYVISAKDKMDFTFDRVRSVRSKEFRYIRNFYPERPHLQANYRDARPVMIEYRAHAKDPNAHPALKFFGAVNRPAEELYDLVNDRDQLVNLADNSAYQAQLKEHRQALLDWIAEVDDKGAYPQSDAAVREVIEMWGRFCVSPECQSYRARNKDKLGLTFEQAHPKVEWPHYLKEPTGPAYQKLQSVHRVDRQ